MISLKRHKEILVNSQESLERVLRIYPIWIQKEIDNPHPAGTSPRVIKDLQKRLDIAREIKKAKATKAILQDYGYNVA